MRHEFIAWPFVRYGIGYGVVVFGIDKYLTFDNDGSAFNPIFNISYILIYCYETKNQLLLADTSSGFRRHDEWDYLS